MSVTMQLDLSRIRQNQCQFEWLLKPSDVLQADSSYHIVRPVDLEVELYKDKKKFRLIGHVLTELEISCSRCLELYRMPVDVDFDHHYLPAEEDLEVAEAEVEEEELEISYYKEELIDINTLLHEQFCLALPMKPLCIDNCRGLCANCGTNLNTGSCSCGTDWEDPRLEPLKNLLL